MTLIWLVQGSLDFLFLLLLGMFWWSIRRAELSAVAIPSEGTDLNERVEKAIAAALRGSLAAAGRELEARTQEFERQALQYRQRSEEQLAALNRICERAKNVLHQGQTVFPLSDEENELRAALSVERTPNSSGNIPTLDHVEQTRVRLKSELAVDLRQLLRDQLA